MAKQAHIVVVNHHPTFLNLVEQILSLEGYKATVYPAGDDSHALIASAQPDVIVVDTWLQTRDEGWELLQTLRLDETTRHIPIVLASSDAERVKERAAEQSAMKNIVILRKPFDPESLLRAIDRIVNPANKWDSDAAAALDEPPA